MEPDEFIKAAEHLHHLYLDISNLYSTGRYLYDKSMQLQEIEPQESNIYFQSSFYNFQYQVIKFVSFVDAYNKLVNKNMDREKAKKVKEAFKKVEVEKLRDIRDVMLAHHFQKKIKGGYESALQDIYAGKYNFGSGNPNEYEHIMEVSKEVLDIVFTL